MRGISALIPHDQALHAFVSVEPVTIATRGVRAVADVDIAVAAPAQLNSATTAERSSSGWRIHRLSFWLEPQPT